MDCVIKSTNIKCILAISIMADDDNNSVERNEQNKGTISPEHRLDGGEREERSPTRSPEKSPARTTSEEEDSDKENDRRKRKRSPSPAKKQDLQEVPSVDENEFALSKPKRKKDRHMWSLPEQLAGYFNDLTKEYFDDDDLRDELGVPIKEVNPVPENIQKVPKLDSFLEEDWREKKFLVENDNDVARVQERIRDVMGPLSKVWLTLEGVKKDPEAFIDIKELVAWTQQSVLLLAQASNAATYKRRIDVLKNAHGSRHAATTAIKKQSDTLMKSGDDLFGQEFKKLNKSTLKDSKDAGTLLGKSAHAYKKQEPSRKRDEKHQPFASAPSSRGPNRFSRGGRGGKIQFNNRQGNNNFGKGNNQRVKNLIQLACTNESKMQGSSSFSKKDTRQGSPTRKITFRRKNKTLPGKLESPHEGQKDFECGQGLGDPTFENSTSNKPPSPYCLKPFGKTSSRLRGTKHVGKGSYQGSNPKGIPNVEQYVCETKEHRGLSAHNKSERVESVYTLPSLQDGGFKRFETVAQQGGLPLQARPEGCLLLGTPGNSISKMGEIQLEREIVRVSLPSFWTGTRPEDFHKNHESSHINVETSGNQTDHIPRRHSYHGLQQGGADSSQRYNNFPFPSSGPNHKSREVGIRPNKLDRIPGGYGRQPSHDTVLTSGESSKTEKTLSEHIDFQRSDPPGTLFSDREIEGNCPSNFGSTSAIKVSSESFEERATTNLELRDSSHTGQGLCHGTKMVEGEPRHLRGKTPSDGPPRHDNTVGCSQDRGLGSILWTHSNRGNLECEGSRLGHKYPRTDSCRTGNKNFYQVSESEIDSYSNRQHSSSFIPSENGGDRQYAYECDNKKNLEIPSRTQNQPHCRMDSNTHEHLGRLGVKALSGLQRMETLSEYIPQNLPKIWNAKPRPICIQKLPPAPQICELEARPSMSVCRRIQPRVEPAQTLCFPTILPNYKGYQESIQGSSTTHDFNNPIMVNTTMVPRIAGDVNPRPHHLTKIPKPAKKSEAGKPPTDKGIKHDISGMEHFRSSLKARGISEETSEIMSNSRTKGTRVTYSYAWKKWVGWCSQRSIDSSDSTLGNILDFLTFCFHNKKAKFRYLGVFRSAISAYHKPIEGCKVGSHPLISQFMAGVQNLRPPMPKYTEIWDVDDVLKCIQNLPQPLSVKQLSCKTAMLLALIVIPRGAEINMLDVDMMGLTRTKCIFTLKGLPKNKKKGKKTPELDFDNYKEDINLCPIKSLQDYCDLTEPFRKINKETSLFLSLPKPHFAVSKSSTARWIKQVLKWAGIDTKIYQAHSVRAAATSKAFMKGLSVSDIIKKGNWSQESTWQKFYNKNIKPVSSTFQDKVLGGL